MDKDELGQSTWKLLHTMAAVYPEKPSTSQKEDIKTFFGIMSRAYPCDICAKDLAQEYDDDVKFSWNGENDDSLKIFAFLQIKRRTHCSELQR